MSVSARERKITIDGKEYTILVLPARAGIKIGTELINMMAPIIGAVIDESNNEDIRLDESTLWTEVAVHIQRNFASERVAAIIDVLLAEMTAGGSRVVYDDEFAGRLGKLAVLIEFTLRENFSDFFTDFFKEKGLEIPSLKTLMGARASTDTAQNEE